MESEGREDAMRAVFVRAVAAPFAGVVRVLVLGSGRWRADGMRSRVERCGEVCAMRCAVRCGAGRFGGYSRRAVLSMRPSRRPWFTKIEAQTSRRAREECACERVGVGAWMVVVVVVVVGNRERVCAAAE